LQSDFFISLGAHATFYPVGTWDSLFRGKAAGA